MSLIDANKYLEYLDEKFGSVMMTEEHPLTLGLWEAEKIVRGMIALEAIELPPVVHGEWVSVKDSLPKIEESVLILTAKGTIAIAIYEDGTLLECDSSWCWEELSGKYDVENDCYMVDEGWWEFTKFNADEEMNHAVDEVVTHWMPLPEPPEREDK